jgi:uncharacterized protein YoxC
MANEMNKDPDQSGTEPASPPVDESSPSKAVNKFNDYLESPLETDVKQATGAVTVGCLAYEDGKSGSNIRVCRLEDAHKVRAEYRGIQNCISSTLAAHAGGVKDSVVEYVVSETALSAKLTTALEAIKAAKKQMTKVRGIVCKLEDAQKDSCNSEQCKAIDKGLPMANGEKGLKRFNAEVSAIAEETKELCVRTDGIFDVGVKYAGIQASVNVACLTDAMTLLKKDADGLVTNVTENGTALDAKITTQQTALDGEIDGLGAALKGRLHGERYHAALLDLQIQLTDISGEDCSAFDEAAGKERIEEICTTAVTTFKTTSPCGDGQGGTNKFNTQDNPSC